MNNEQYIEHEVQLRVHDEKFKEIDKQFHKLESKLNWLITLVVSGILLPVVLKFMHLT